MSHTLTRSTVIKDGQVVSETPKSADQERISDRLLRDWGMLESDGEKFWISEYMLRYSRFPAQPLSLDAPLGREIISCFICFSH